MPGGQADCNPSLQSCAATSKVFHSHAKATRSCVLWMNVGKLLEMAADLHRPPVDEVARNGAFWNLLRPEVFSGLPLCNLQFAGPLSAFSDSPPPKVVRTVLRGTGQSAFLLATKLIL